ncbi:MAG: hypothetical protein IT366_01980 [Candidatus Hydrogenedentes bacterium]|nr:hypothetical protein [Candidatus Hydrogenedentota bacterium]
MYVSIPTTVMAVLSISIPKGITPRLYVSIPTAMMAVLSISIPKGITPRLYVSIPTAMMAVLSISIPKGLQHVAQGWAAGVASTQADLPWVS